MVHKLSKKLHRRLCSKLLQCRHVHVIYKDDTLLSHGRPKHSLPSLIQPGHDDILGEAVNIEYMI